MTNTTLTVIGTNADGTTIISTNITIAPVTVGSNSVLITNYIAVEPMGSNSFQDAVFMNGMFDGSVQNKYPNQTFSAQGTIAQQQIVPQEQTNPNNAPGTVPVQMSEPLQIPVTVQGLRISDAYSSFTTISNAIPYTITTYTVTNIPSQQGGL